MAIIKVPESIATSPQDSGPLTFNTATGLFKDRSENLYGIDDLAGSRQAGRIRKWYRENYPEGEVIMVETDPMKCPGCGGPADNGHDRELPPNPYYCEACVDAGLPSMLAAMADANRAFDDFDWDTD